MERLLYPLNEFYEQSGLPLPSVVKIEGSDVPAPYRQLLVHKHDMTPTLKEAYQRKIHLRVLKYFVRAKVYSRQIVLLLEDDTPVEFGAIKIYLEHFPPRARRLILEKKQPLGTILHTQGIAHTSRPAAYIQVTADDVISDALHLTAPCLLYGRRNMLFDSSQNVLAQIVEILPPSSTSDRRVP